jgi:hypothetical protein
MSTCSRRAILREKNRWGKEITYQPRAPLIARLSDELGLNASQIVEQLQKERQWLLKHRKYFY